MPSITEISAELRRKQASDCNFLHISEEISDPPSWQRQQQIKMLKIIETEHLTLPFIEQSNIERDLRLLELVECSKYPRHRVIKRFDKSGAILTLAWGEKFSVDLSGNINFEKGSDGQGLKKYSYIDAFIFPTGNIRIDTQDYDLHEWRENPVILPIKLAEDFYKRFSPDPKLQKFTVLETDEKPGFPFDIRKRLPCGGK